MQTVERPVEAGSAAAAGTGLPAADHDKVLFNKRQLGKALGVSVPTIDGWVEEGCPVESYGKNGIAYQFDPDKVEAWRHEQDEARAAEQARIAEAVAQRQLDLVGGEARSLPTDRDTIQTELLRMKAEQARGELVTAEDLRQDYQDLFTFLGQSLQAIPDRISRQVGLEAGQHARLVEAIDDIQTELANRLMSRDDARDAA